MSSSTRSTASTVLTCEDRIWSAFTALVAALDTGPPRLLHGDVHAGNVFYVDGTRGGLLDWQLSPRGNWSLDVTYILQTALTPAQRAAHERDLLRRHLTRLSSMGVRDAPTFDDAWLRYCQSALYGIAMWLITPDGVHSDEAQAENLRRCLIAGEDLETLAALGFRARHSTGGDPPRRSARLPSPNPRQRHST